MNIPDEWLGEVRTRASVPDKFNGVSRKEHFDDRGITGKSEKIEQTKEKK